MSALSKSNLAQQHRISLYNANYLIASVRESRTVDTNMMDGRMDACVYVTS